MGGLARLGQIALLLGLALVFMAPIDQRSYVAGNFFLELDGKQIGFLKSVEGGNATAEVVKEAAGATYFEKKHLGTLKYEDITLTVGAGASRALYDWIAASWQMNYQRKNGAIIFADYKMDAQSKLEFFNALITEVSIPAADGASKEAVYMTIKISPEYTRLTKASGKVGATYGKAEQKMWLPSNFRVTIDGLDATKVAKVDSFTVKQSAVQSDIGEARDYLKEPGKLEFPNITVYVAQTSAQSWYDWHKAFVIDGNNDESKEKGGTLEFLGPNTKDVLLTLKFFNIGLFKIAEDKAEANADHIKRVKAEMYVERMELEAKQAVQ